MPPPVPPMPPVMPKRRANPSTPYREQYLTEVTDAFIRPHFHDRGFSIPPNLRISVGWPSSRALSPTKRVLGEAWDTECSEDGSHEVVVSLCLDSLIGPEGVLAVLVHELAHTCVGVAEKHGPAFRQCAKAVGLEGKMTSTNATEELCDLFAEWEATFGAYPHAKLDSRKKTTPKQKCRMLLMTCVSCGCKVRTTQTWIDLYGLSWACPCGQKLQGEPPEEEFDPDE